MCALSLYEDRNFLFKKSVKPKTYITYDFLLSFKTKGIFRVTGSFESLQNLEEELCKFPITDEDELLRY
jgi:hypothetical protein